MEDAGKHTPRSAPANEKTVRGVFRLPRFWREPYEIYLSSTQRFPLGASSR